MNKKISLGVTIALILIAVTASIAITMSFAMNQYDALIEGLPEREEMYARLSALDDEVREKYYGSIDNQQLNAELASGYMQGLGDEYSYYMTASEYIAYDVRFRRKMSGIGISTVFYEETGVLSIV